MQEVNWKELERGLRKYLKIMENFKSSDVSLDPEFQRNFKGFYRVRRGKEFCSRYFSILQDNKNNSDITFEMVLRELMPLGKLKASFSSKLLATINPELPIWDSVVLKNIEHEFSGIQKESNRLNIAVYRYNCILKWYKNKINSDKGKEMISAFNAKHANNQLTDTKKIDLMLWQTRA